MIEKTINGMHKGELLDIIKNTVENVNKIDLALKKAELINSVYIKIQEKEQNVDDLYEHIDNTKLKIDAFLKSIEVSKSDIESAHNEILDEEGFLTEIEQAHDTSLKKLKVIKNSYEEIHGGEENTGIKDKLANLVTHFNSKNEEIEEVYDVIFNTGYNDDNVGFLESMKNAQTEANDKLSGINKIYSNIFTDIDEEKCIKNKVDGFVSEIQEYNNEFKNIHNDIFGYIEYNNEEEKKHLGELNRTRKIFKKYQNKHNDLFEQIESLLSGATTTSLSKNFDDKVKEYKEERGKWEDRTFYFLIVLFAASILFAIVLMFIDIEKSMIYTIGAPVYTFGIWFMIFMGNRRAESRKLEESFKHKFVMAKSFVGYKKSILEMTDRDDTLMNIHMNNLLNAISKDSSKFFDIKGESHPITDFFKKNKNKNNKNSETS
jgi:hypothetical protein